MLQVMKTTSKASLERIMLTFGIYVLHLHVGIVLLIELYILMRLVFCSCPVWWVVHVME